MVVGRLDGRFAFVPSTEGLSALHVILVEDACRLPDPPDGASNFASSSSPAGEGGPRLSGRLKAALAAERRRVPHPAEAADGRLAAAQQGVLVAADRATAGKATKPSRFHHGIKGAAALVVQKQGSPLGCSYPQLLRRLGHVGAAAAIVGSVPGEDVTEMQCRWVQIPPWRAVLTRISLGTDALHTARDKDSLYSPVGWRDRLSRRCVWRQQCAAVIVQGQGV